jgi:cell wall-associated NlpC family hydrolase
MKYVVLTCTLVCALLGAMPSRAQEVDTMDQFLADNGFVQQASHLRQSIGHKASDLIVNAMSFLGVPYKRGGTSGETGFDCSGFVRAMYERTVGLVLPRRASEQAAATQSIDSRELKPGDLVFFNTMHRAFSHVGIYVGEGKFIHSPSSGKTVRIDDMRQDYWAQRFNGARRVEHGSRFSQ